LHIDAPVDENFKIVGLSRRLMKKGSDKACMLWNITSSLEGWHVESPYQICLEGGHRHIKMFEDPYNVSRKDFFKNWFEKLAKPLPPKIVKDGTCKGVVLKADDVDLQKIPVECRKSLRGECDKVGCFAEFTSFYSGVRDFPII
jgi:3-polyprenyl-4-hydroxybenzoate decarboxylase